MENTEISTTPVIRVETPTTKYNNATKLAGSLALAATVLINIPGCDDNNLDPSVPPSSDKPTTSIVTPTSKPDIQPTFTTESPTITPTTTPTKEPAPTVKPTSTPMPDNLKYKDRLPADIVSEKELADTYHTHIYNTSDIKFHIREAALTEENMFKWLKTKDYYTDLNGAKREVDKSLDVVLVNGQTVHPKYMTEEQRKLIGLEYKPLTKQEIDMSREKQRAQFEQYFQTAKTLNPNDQATLNWISSGREAIARRLDHWTEDDAIMYTNVKSGWHLIGPKKDEKGNLVKERHVILLAVKGRAVEHISVSGGSDLILQGFGALDPKDSYPSPDSLVPSARSDHKYAGQTTGFANSHEWKHFDSLDEFKTDSLTAARIKKAWEAYKTGDDSLYYFVFETPKGNIVTDTPKNFTEPNRADTKIARGPIQGPQTNFQKGRIPNQNKRFG